MMRFKSILATGIFGFTISVLAASCDSPKEDNKNQAIETQTKGNIKISVDESLMPVIAQQLTVFDSSYPEGHIHPTYTSEQQCFTDLFKDSARLIVVARDLTQAEKDAFEKNDIRIKSMSMAKDAIAVIVHPGSVDSFMTLGQLKQILLGKFARQYTIVVEDEKSSTVRYMLDSLIPGQQLSKQTFTIKNNDSLISYVASNEHAIGFIGVTHVYDPESTVPEGSFKKQIQVVSLKNENDTAVKDFYQPYQAWIALKYYPLARTMYFITRDTYNGLGTGLGNFLTSQQGQLIFNKARLVPLRVPLNLRPAEIKE
jgi:phosphate transport system substrate-binding protein